MRVANGGKVLKGKVIPVSCCVGCGEHTRADVKELQLKSGKVRCHVCRFLMYVDRLAEYGLRDNIE